MTQVSPERKYLQEEELKYKAAVSSATGFKLGKMLNFLGLRIYQQKPFFLNGPYFVVADPQLGVDGLYVFEFNAEIFNVWMFNLVAGSAGTTELDIKLATSPGGAFSSIFSTTPKINSTASNNVWIWVGETVTGCTAPVLTSQPLNVNAGDAIRLDKISSMTGAENCGLLIHYRSR